MREMLKSEKYEANALLHKTYTVDFLKKKRAESEGEINKYYVEDNYLPA